jgi:hypothetical protein
METTSFSSRVLAYLAVTLFWPIRCRVNSLFLYVVTQFPDMDVAQYKTCVTRTATRDRDQVRSLSIGNGFIHPSFIYSNTNPNLLTIQSLSRCKFPIFVKLRISHLEKELDWECLRTVYWTECLDLRRGYTHFHNEELHYLYDYWLFGQYSSSDILNNVS